MSSLHKMPWILDSVKIESDIIYNKKTKQLNLLAFDIPVSDLYHAFTINLFSVFEIKQARRRRRMNNIIKNIFLFSHIENLILLSLLILFSWARRKLFLIFEFNLLLFLLLDILFLIFKDLKAVESYWREKLFFVGNTGKIL